MKIGTGTRLLLIMSFIAALLLAACGEKAEEGSDAGQKAVVVENTDPQTSIVLADGEGDSLVLELSGVDSMSVFEVLRRHHEVNFLSAIKGKFVVSIDLIENSGGYYWVYSVNDSMPPMACDRYLTKEGDVIKWLYRRSGKMQM